MTSAKYYSNWFKEAGRGHIGALLSGVSFLSYLVLTLMGLAEDTEYNFYGIGNRELLYICAGLGIALAFVEFSYLFQQKKQDFYYSLPVKKGTIFWTRYFHGVFIFILPFLLVQGVCGIYETGRDTRFLPYAAGYTGRSLCMFMLVFLLFYHISILAVMVSGKVLVSIFMLSGIVFYFQILIEEVFLVFAGNLFRTFYRIPFLEHMEEMLVPWNLSTILSGSSLFEKKEIWGYYPGTALVTAAVVFIILFLAVSVWMHRNRKAEMTGKSFVSKIPERIGETALSLLGGLFLSGLLLRMLRMDSEDIGYMGLLLCGAGLAGTFLIHMFIEWMLKMADDSIFRRKGQIFLEGAGVILIVFSFLGMQKTFDGFRAKAGDMESLAVSVGGLDITEEQFEAEKNSRDSYITDQRLENYVLKDDGLENGLEWIEELTPDKEEGKEAAVAVVCYHMKDGKEKYRSYKVNREELDSFADVYETWEYKEKVYPLVREEDIRDDRVTWTDGIIEKTLKLTSQEKDEFLMACKYDIEAMHMADLYDELPIGSITIESDRSRSKFHTVIYPFWEQTVNFLRKHGVEAGKELADYTITGLEVRASASDAAGNPGGASVKFYRDKEDIRKWAGKLIPKELAVQPVLHPVSPGTEVEAEVEDETTNSVKVIQCFMTEIPSVDKDVCALVN